MMLGGVGLCAEMLYGDRYIVSAAETADKEFVAVALGSAKSKIAMQGLNVISRLFKHKQQSHAVCASADCNEKEGGRLTIEH